MKKHKIKTAKTRLFAVCWAAAVILTAAFFVTSCGDKMPNAPRITITIEGDGNVTGVPVSIKIGRGLKWAKIKPLAEKKIGFKTGFELKEWQFKEKSTLINDTDVFIKDTVIFAASRKELPKVKLTVKGDANIKGVPAEIKINKGSPWSAAKNQVLAKVSAKAGFEISGWKYDSASGAPVGEADTFGTDKTVYAVSAKIVPKYTITIDGDSYVTGKPAKLENIREGTLWAAVKAQAEAKITVDDTRDLSKWLLGKNGSTIADNYEIKSNITAYAETVPTANPKITITVAAGSGAEVTIASPAAFKVNKGSIWADIKAKAEAKVTCNEGYAIKEWKKGDFAPLFDGYIFNSDEAVYVETEKLSVVTFSVEGEGGTLTAKVEGMPETSTSPIYVLQGKTVTFTAVPDENYKIGSWTVSGGAFTEGGGDGEASAKITATGDITVNVSFIRLYKVTFSVEGGGTLKASSAEIPNLSSGSAVSSGTVVTFTATPNKEEYAVKKWTTSGGSFEEGTGTAGSTTAKLKVMQDVTVKAHFGIWEVAYTDLEAFLKSGKLKNGIVNHIKITGTIPVQDFKGNNFNTGTLGKKIKKTNKKIALILPENINNVTSMYCCFYECENLVSVKNLPQSVYDMSYCFSRCYKLAQAPVIPQGVTNMRECFKKCALTKAPAIPNSVTDMSYCFLECNLTQGPDIPQKVTKMYGCFYDCKKLKTVKLHCPLPDTFDNLFHGCSNITPGGIKVKYAYLEGYKNKAVDMGTTADRFSGF